MQPDEQRGRAHRAWSVAGGCGAVAAALVGYAVISGAERFALTGDGYPGAVTSAAELVGQFAATLAGAVCLGALGYIVTASRTEDDGRIGPAAFRVHLLLERAAIMWLVSAGAMIVVAAASGNGVSVGRLVSSAALLDAIGASEPARGWCGAAVFAALVAVGARFTLRWIGHLVLMIPALLAVIAVPVTGNAGQGPDHDLATSGVIVFAAALAMLTGVKIAATVSPPEPALRPRVQMLQVGTGVVALVYGAVLAPLMVTGTAVLGSDYGRLMVAAGCLLAAVVLTDVVGLRRPPGPASPVTVGTALALIAVLGALSAMAVQPAPRFGVHAFTTWDVLLGYQLPGPPTLLNLVTTWRFDPLIGTGAALFAVAYLLGVARLRRRGDTWPVGRSIAWTAGCAALLVTTGSGVRAYGSAMFSVHMGEHMALNMFIPVVLVLGAPVTLALRALHPAAEGRPPGPREWLQWLIHSRVTGFLSHPVTAFVLFVGSLYAVYFSPLFDTLVRYHWGHEFMAVHFLLTGYLYFWGIIGIDPGPKRLPFLGRMGLLFAVMPFHAFFGIAAMTMTTPIGGDFYRGLALPWVASIIDDQHVGGAIAWASSELPVLVVVAALVVQWARQDRRTGARYDRHADSGYDDDLDAYNAMLAELARGRR